MKYGAVSNQLLRLKIDRRWACGGACINRGGDASAEIATFSRGVLGSTIDGTIATFGPGMPPSARGEARFCLHRSSLYLVPYGSPSRIEPFPEDTCLRFEFHRPEVSIGCH